MMWVMVAASVWRRCSSPPSPSKSTSKNATACPTIPPTQVEAHIAAPAGRQRTNPHTGGRTTVQKGVGKGQRTCPHQRVQTQEEEGPEEVAAHMCLYVTITWFNKNVS